MHHTDKKKISNLSQLTALWFPNPSTLYEGIRRMHEEVSLLGCGQPRLTIALKRWLAPEAAAEQRGLILISERPRETLKALPSMLRESLGLESLEVQALPLSVIPEKELIDRFGPSVSEGPMKLYTLSHGGEARLLGSRFSEGLMQPSALVEASGAVLSMPMELWLQSPKAVPYLLPSYETQREEWAGLYAWEARGCRGLRRPLPPMDLKVRWILVGTQSEVQAFYRLVSGEKPRLPSVVLSDEFPATSWRERFRWGAILYRYLRAQYPKLSELAPETWAELFLFAHSITESLESLPLYWGEIVDALERGFQLQRASDSGKQGGEVLQLPYFLQGWREARFQGNRYQASARKDYLSGQYPLDFNQERVGQLYGLAVSEVPPEKGFGLPFRLSCVAYKGDGELLDVDGKLGLGGTLHLKGMAILQAYLRSLLQLEHPLPLTSSIVSEQGYEPFDGDSGSLAEFCCWFSSLSQVPLKQALAVTGSMDQQGRVQAVGGIEAKICGFWEICKSLDFPKGCGVIFPQSNLPHLVLPRNVRLSYLKGAFRLIPVSQASQALTILTALSLESLKKRLEKRLKEEEQGRKEGDRRWWHRFLYWKREE